MIDGAVAPHSSLATVRVTRRNFVIGASDANHGTAVASILAGRDPTGAALASGVHLHVATVIGRENAESVADAAALVEGLDWLAASGVRFVNISIAGPRNDVVEAAVRAAADRGVILVAAAGNAGREAPPRFPAAYEDVIAVSAIDRRGRPYLHGNRGEYVEIAAPGVDVWGALAGGDGALWTGTSFAAPFVTTALAIQAGEARIGDVADARAFLARATRDLGPKGRDPVFGAGLV
ncbi:MAG: S8 family serine peptidase, partial [Pseudomonadota bacterium]